MDVRAQDREFADIQNTIRAKRQYLLDKQHSLRRLTKENAFLKTVRSDYKEFGDYIRNQQHEQVAALEMLHHYVADLEKSGELSKRNVEDNRREQQKILSEINKLREGIKKATRGVENLASAKHGGPSDKKQSSIAHFYPPNVGQAGHPPIVAPYAKHT